MQSHYENYRLCPDLQPHETCFVVQQYHEGEFVRLLHHHVRSSQLSDETRRDLLKALVIKFSDMPPDGIIKYYLNSRGEDSSRDWYQAQLPWHVSYPGPGVIRSYCGSDTSAWADRVIRKDMFRQNPVEVTSTEG
jgi:hypothetical protein